MSSQQRSSNAPEGGSKDLGGRLDLLERAIKEFRIDAYRFFGGELKVPPEPLREKIVNELRRLRSFGLSGVAERFRLSSLEARFNSEVQFYNRRLRERELGSVTASQTTAEPAPDARQGVVLGKDRNAVEVLYKGLYVRDGKSSSKMDLDRFRTYLQRQSEAIRTKTGCADIRFRIETVDGKLKLKARPVR